MRIGMERNKFSNMEKITCGDKQYLKMKTIMDGKTKEM